MIIDISHHNGKINWQSISKEVDCLFIKATEGTSYVDSMFLKNAIAAHDAGIKTGYYHFATLRSQQVYNDAKTEAYWFLGNIKKAPIPSMPLVLDFEDEKINLSKADSLLFITTFFGELLSHGYNDVMLYGGTSFLNAHLPANHNLGHIPLWIADYNEPSFVPVGWDKITLLQHTDKGKVNGIVGYVDLNRYI